jgi:hypothetical protein
VCIPDGPPDDGTALLGGIKVAARSTWRALIERHLILFSAEVTAAPLRRWPATDGSAGMCYSVPPTFRSGVEFSSCITGTLNLQDADLAT